MWGDLQDKIKSKMVKHILLLQGEYRIVNNQHLQYIEMGNKITMEASEVCAPVPAVVPSRGKKEKSLLHFEGILS